jgi:hypothetical protein
MFQEILEKLALALDTRQIPYMIIGGQAVLLYGEPRLTKDIDLTLGRSADGVGEILELAGQLSWNVLVEHPVEFVRDTLVLPCQDPSSGIRLDFIFSFSDYEQQALKRTRQVPIGRAQVRFASPEDVVIHKMIAARPRDLDDVENLLTKNRDLDVDYIRKWLGQFEQTLSQSLLMRFDDLWQSSR